MPGTLLDKAEVLSVYSPWRVGWGGQTDKQAGHGAGILNFTTSARWFPNLADVRTAGAFPQSSPQGSLFQSVWAGAWPYTFLPSSKGDLNTIRVWDQRLNGMRSFFQGYNGRI